MDTRMHDINWTSLHHAYILFNSGREAYETLLEKVKEKSEDYVFCRDYDTFTIDNAREIKYLQQEKSNNGGSRFFVLSCEIITKEAQNALLKVLEEPSEHTYFFIVYRGGGELLPTLLSRVFQIRSAGQEMGDIPIQAKEFLRLGVKDRLDRIKELTGKGKEKEPELDTEKARALLSMIEKVVYEGKRGSDPSLQKIMREIYIAKRFLVGKAPSVKIIFDHLATVLPQLP